jgi:ABC-type transport system involved in cytochrome c biogenesis permease subunit
MLVLLRRSNILYPVARGAFRIGTTLQAVAIVDLGMALHHVPVDNVFQTMNLCAFLIAALFLAVEWKYLFATTAVAHFPLVFVMTLVAATEPERQAAAVTNAHVKQTWLVIHIVLALAGYASLILTAVASICYLVQERRLKSKKPARLLEKLPPLATLDNLISGSLGLAFVLITLAVVLVITWEFMYSDQAWIGDPRVMVSLVTWALLVAATYLRATAGWRGRRAAVMALVVLGCSMITWRAWGSY